MRFAVSIACALFSMASNASAQEDSSAEDPGRALFQRGVELLRAGAPRDAAEAFRQSYAAVPRAAAICNLALAYEQSGENAEALSAYERCAEHPEGERFREHALERAAALRAMTDTDADPIPDAVDANETVADGEPATDPVVAPTPAETAETAQTTDEPRPFSPQVDDHTLLYVGITTAFIGTSAVVTALVLALHVQSDEEMLRETYPTGEIPTTIGGVHNRDIDVLESARDRGTASDVLYVGGAIAGIGGLACIAIDLATSSSESPYAAVRFEGNGVSFRGAF